MQIQPFSIQPISSVQPMKRENNKRNDDNNKQKKETKKENNFKETLDKAMKRQYNSIRKRGKQHDEYKVQ